MSAEPRPGQVPATTDEQVAHDHAEHARRHPERLVATLLRTRSVSGRAVLAILAGGPGTTAAELEELGRSIDAGARAERDLSRAARQLAQPDAGVLAQYAWVVALQRGTAPDVSAALGLLRLVEWLSHGALPTGREADLWSQLLVVRNQPGDALEAQRVLDRGRGVGADGRAGTPQTAALTRIDLAHPALTEATDAVDLTRAEGRWWSMLSAQLGGTGTGTSTVRLGAVDDLFDRRWLARHGLDADALVRSRFDRLVGEPGRPVHHPFRVTVVMSAIDPGPHTLLAARSVVSQTWQNWELLVVDDATEQPDEGILTALADLDPRIQVIRKAVRGGTYRARNTALRRATGDALVALDSDDWAHPDLLETAVRPLLEHSGPERPDHQSPRRPAVATRQRALRVTDDLRVTRPGYPGSVECGPSLMVPLVPSVATVGFFDPVRKGADTEYAHRLEAATGRPVEQGDAVLVLMRQSQDSLSASDFSRGWRHPARHEYKAASARWHARIARGEDPWRDPMAPSPLVAPAAWSTRLGVPGAPREQLDVVLAGDWRGWGGPQRSMVQEIHSLLDAGHSVGVLHLEALRFMRTTDDPLCTAVQDLMLDRRVRRVHLDDAVDVGLLLLRYPPILQYPPTLPPTMGHATLQARRLGIVANQAPSEPDGSDQRYAVSTVERHARELFGTPAVWIPQGPTLRRLLQDETSALADWDDPGLIEPSEWPVRPVDRPLPERPVVGRYSRDDRIKFPDTWDALVAAYDHGPGVQVRMMGATRTVKRLRSQAQRAGGPVREPGSAWEVLPHGAMPVKDFLAGVDVFVHADHPAAHEAFGRSLLEAAATGVPVVTTPKHRENFGDLLMYAEPQDMPAVVADLLTDPERYARQRAHQLQGVQERYSRQSFVAHVEAMSSTATPPTAEATGDDTPDRPSPPARIRVTSHPGRHGLRCPMSLQTRAPDADTPTGAHQVLALRRPADAEAADAVGAVGGEQAVARALDVIDRALDAGASERAALEQAAAVAGITALLLSRDAQVAALVPDGTQWSVGPSSAGGHPTVDLVCPAGPPTSGLVWDRADPVPERVTVAARAATPAGSGS